MRKLLLVFLLYIIASQVSAQDNRFVYIQSEAHKPFYVRINYRHFKASADGYLLIPGLPAGSYQVFIGSETQPGSEWKFNLNLGNEDLAFILKSRSSGLELEPLGDARVITGEIVANKSDGGTSYRTPVITGPASDDAFSMMLSGVVNDPTIREASALIQKQDLADIKETPAPAPAATTQEPASAAPVASAPTTPAPGESNDSAAKAATTSLTEDLIAGLSKKAETSPVTESSKNTTTITETAPATPVASAPANSTTSASTDSAKKSTTSLSDDLITGLGKMTESNPGSASDVRDNPVINNPARPAPAATATTPTNSVTTTDSAKKATTSLSNDLIAGLSKKEETGATDNKQPKVTAPTTVASEPTQPAVENNAAYEAPFVVKEVKTTEQKPTAATASENKPVTSSGNNEPFVVKEVVPAAKKEVTAADTPTATEQKPADNKPTQGNQPFVIKEKLIIDSDKPGNGVSASIKKTLQRRSSDGIELIYIDEQTNGVKDIIRILIPAN